MIPSILDLIAQIPVEFRDLAGEILLAHDRKDWPLMLRKIEEYKQVTEKGREKGLRYL